MKRVLCFLLVLIALGTSLVAVTGYSLVKESDNVTFTLVDEWGDRRYLEGVTAGMQFSHNGRLQWDVEFVPCGETKTQYRFNNILPDSSYSGYYKGFSTTNFDIFDLKNDNEKLNADIENLKNETENSGDIRHFSIKLKDYYEHYPVNLDLTLDGISVLWESGRGFEDKGKYCFEGISPARGRGFLKAVNEFLKIPVYEEDVREVTVYRGDGPSFSYQCNYKSCFSFDFYNAVFSDKLYFTFSNEISNGHEEKRVLVDTSLIPGGYGIYSVPYGKGDVKYDEIKTAYSIPENSTVEALFCDEERNEMYLCLHENGKYVLHIIDADAMADVTVIELFGFSYEDWTEIKQYDDFFVFIKNNTEFCVVKRNPDGKYEEYLRGVMPEENVTGRGHFPSDSFFGFDGERLVMLVIRTNDYYDDEAKIGMSIQPDITVFTKDGISYYGKWICSLSDPLNNWRGSFVSRSGKSNVKIS